MGSSRKGLTVHALTAAELVKQLAVDDSSLHALGATLKNHSKLHAQWIAYRRPLVKRLKNLQRQLKRKECELVAQFSQTAKSAAATTNYAKYEVPLHPDIKRLETEIDECTELIEFVRDVSSLFRERASLMSDLLKLDVDALIVDNKSTFDLNVEARDAIKRFNDLTELMGRPWKAGDTHE